MKGKSWGYLGMAALTLVCTGCWDSTEINELGIVTASGIELVDPHNPHSKVRGYVQVARPSELSSDPNGGGKTGDEKSFVLESATGETAAGTLQKVQQSLSRRFFFRDRRVTVVGEHFARRGMTDLLDEALRNPDARLRSFLVVADGCRTGDIMRLPYPLARLPADAIADLEARHAGVTINVVQFIKAMTGKGDPYVSGIRIVHNQASTQKKGVFELADVAVFRRDRMVGWLRGDAAKGFALIQPQSHRLRLESLAVPLSPGRWLTSQLIILNKTVHLTWGRHGPQVSMAIEAQDDILENNSSLMLDRPRDLHLAEFLLGNTMRQQVLAALDALQHQYQADCVGFGDAFFAAYPRQWRKVEGHWRQVYAQMPITVTVKVHVVRSGLTGDSLRDQLTVKGE
ncbi:MAG: Ger(x)C family spore germination protein [Firmicutes bacterium]|nr:Ger(x)C family spore germination protein [Bacillota bacterium]